MDFGNDDRPVGVDDEERRRRRGIMDQRSGDALKQKWAAEDRTDIEMAEQNMAPPIITEKRCFVCQSEYRTWIERQLLKGRSMSSIARSLPPHPTSGKQLDHRHISNHKAKHMPLDSAVVRAILEEEADLLGQNWEEGVKGAFTNRGALDVLIRKAYQDALDGVTTVEPRDLIQMIKLHNDMQVSSAGATEEEAKLAIRLFMLAIQNVLVKGDMIDAELGMRLMVAISEEVNNLRAQEAITADIEGNLTALMPAHEDPLSDS